MRFLIVLERKKIELTLGTVILHIITYNYFKVSSCIVWRVSSSSFHLLVVSLDPTPIQLLRVGFYFRSSFYLNFSNKFLGVFATKVRITIGTFYFAFKIILNLLNLDLRLIKNLTCISENQNTNCSRSAVVPEISKIAFTR